MNEYYSGDVGKCPFATAAFENKRNESSAALNQLAEFAAWVPGVILGTAAVLVALVGAIALVAWVCSAGPSSILIIVG